MELELKSYQQEQARSNLSSELCLAIMSGTDRAERACMPKLSAYERFAANYLLKNDYTRKCIRAHIAQEILK